MFSGLTFILLLGSIGWLIWKVFRMDASIHELQIKIRQLSGRASDVSAQPEKATQEYSELRIDEQSSAKEPEESFSSPFENEGGAQVPETPVVEKHISTQAQLSWGDTIRHSADNSVDFDQGMDRISDHFGARFNTILTWFMSGNMLVRIGSVVLFFGAGFLLKYAAEHSQLSIEIRMLGIVLGACAMLGVGWYLRASRPVYALALQGGGLGLLYLTIFASFRLYELLAASHALILLALISGAGVAMAVAHNARWLAILSFAGGFLAPILASTGTGSHVALFSWYAVLNIGIAILAWHKAWRSLNLLGMIATFIIAALWGNQYYQLSFFDSVEPFLIGFGLLYLAVGVLFSLHRADPEQEGFGRVDASIIFGTPVGFFLLQTPLVHDFEHGMSLSALLSGLVYLGASGLAYRQENRMLTMALLSIAVTLLTLAIPLEFDEAETAAVWAMEGVGLIWLGLAQKSQRALLTGVALQLLAAGCWLLGSPLVPTASYGSALSALLIGLSGWGCATLLDRDIHWQKEWPGLQRFLPKNLACNFQCWGLIWWLAAGLTELHRHFHDHDMLLASIVWITLSAWLVEGLGLRMGWQLFRRLNSGLVILWLGALSIQSAYVDHPTEEWGLMVWLPAVLTAFWMLYRIDLQADEEKDDSSIYPSSGLFHVASVCFLLLIFVWELRWQVSEWISTPVNMPIWTDMVLGIVTALMLLTMSSNVHRWPVVVHLSSYLKTSATICILALIAWAVWVSQDPLNIPLPYVPLFNPIDLVLGLAGLAVFSWWKAAQKSGLIWFEAKHFYLLAGIAVFMLLNVDIARAVHHWFGIEWSEHTMMRSVEFQAGLSLSWSVLAMLLMSWASRQGLRSLWIGGAALLGIVVIKLFIIDLSGTGTLARIVSFLGVGGLLLIIGYLSPVPPGSDDEAENEESNESTEKA